jgi:hypothetical protein
MLRPGLAMLANTEYNYNAFNWEDTLFPLFCASLLQTFRLLNSGMRDRVDTHLRRLFIAAPGAKPVYVRRMRGATAADAVGEPLPWAIPLLTDAGATKLQLLLHLPLEAEAEAQPPFSSYCSRSSALMDALEESDNAQVAAKQRELTRSLTCLEVLATSAASAAPATATASAAAPASAVLSRTFWRHISGSGSGEVGRFINLRTICISTRDSFLDNSLYDVVQDASKRLQLPANLESLTIKSSASICPDLHVKPLLVALCSCSSSSHAPPVETLRLEGYTLLLSHGRFFDRNPDYHSDVLLMQQLLGKATLRSLTLSAMGADMEQIFIDIMSRDQQQQQVPPVMELRFYQPHSRTWTQRHVDVPRMLRQPGVSSVILRNMMWDSSEQPQPPPPAAPAMTLTLTLEDSTVWIDDNVFLDYMSVSPVTLCLCLCMRNMCIKFGDAALIREATAADDDAAASASLIWDRLERLLVASYVRWARVRYTAARSTQHAAHALMLVTAMPFVPCALCLVPCELLCTGIRGIQCICQTHPCLVRERRSTAARIDPDPRMHRCRPAVCTRHEHG